MVDGEPDLEVAGARSWPRVKWTRASQVTRLLDGGAAIEAVAPFAPAAAFDVLRRSDPPAAARFVAQCLGRADAARWLAWCLAFAEPDPPPARAVAAKAVRRWVAKPSDEARRFAYDAGEIAGWDTTEGIACLAIFLSGGSLAPASQDIPVNPEPGLFGKVAAGAVLAAAGARGGAEARTRLFAMLDRADMIAGGGEQAA